MCVHAQQAILVAMSEQESVSYCGLLRCTGCSRSEFFLLLQKTSFEEHRAVRTVNPDIVGCCVTDDVL